MYNKYSLLLLRLAAAFGVVGAILGAHMAGAGSYAFRPVHAHILVAGWLSLFAWAVYYKVFKPSTPVLAKVHVWCAIIGSVGLSIGMWLYMVKPFELPEAVLLIIYIGGGVTLLISYIVFFFMTIFNRIEG
ncbi:hypothetical protein [Oceanobacillus alkalisoli]|uniref:hypothetical protein n=1 Tax=Oceanobacillus alkalisoli TaxID=2925113 RepID=UPI001EF02253|nr:hypothetical protein [Oceanobacillus alkalisoli]MCF3944697.1 hypothetical protein [Oceanobacillus alkalisoli]MCG5105087.1 hypothetical protein [Oceanobacillus alkalisoli]